MIEHPRTGAGERAAAQRMLDRILTKFVKDGAGDRTHGARHDRVGRHAGLSHIADAIRDDIAFARVVFATATAPGQLAVHDPIRDAPPGISYLVETPHDAGVVITIDDVPREWGWVSEDGIETVSPALRALADELAEIMKGYNRGGADAEQRFFASVRVDGETLVWGSPGC
ncbi:MULTISPECIES: hypothetical protein [unclassified Rhodococcus (in: high G+C Gram-positive bacteria)]|uniref:hypothetical protein n=1 Tax=unclassified Rhodococcus (in: high G+C Gram-positive bacteria) TaxID=192944 RepID=UPI001B46EF78|nr:MULTISPECIES: hypothetical protein [unclassified Rhodococcus (in: high G+C Gram-positive bacteria)]MBP1161916.1 hypothetical protein [Rhodococcus sp. PvR099]